MKTSRLNGTPQVSLEEIEKYVRRFGPVSTSQIRLAMRSESIVSAKIGECKNLRVCRTIGNNRREKVWEYVQP